MNILPVIIAIIFLVIVLFNNKTVNPKVVLVLLVIATIVLLIDALMVSERRYISFVFVIIGTVKIIEKTGALRKMK